MKAYAKNQYENFFYTCKLKNVQKPNLLFKFQFSFFYEAFQHYTESNSRQDLNGCSKLNPGINIYSGKHSNNLSVRNQAKPACSEQGSYSKYVSNPSLLYEFYILPYMIPGHVNNN